MLTNAQLYETNIVYHSPSWNYPPDVKFAVGCEVITSQGVVGVVDSVIPAPPTSSMRCREHGYYVRLADGGKTLFMENELIKYHAHNQLEETTR